MASRKWSNGIMVSDVDFTTPFEQLNAKLKEPKTASETRQHAFKQLTRVGLPHSKNDHFKYAGLYPQLFEKMDFMPETKGSSAVDRFQNIALFDIHRNQMALIYNNELIQHTKQQDFQIEPISGASDHARKEFQELFGTTENSMQLLSQSFASDGIFINIPANTEVAQPIYLFYLAESSHSSLSQATNLIKVGKNSSVAIVEVYCQNSQAASVQNCLTQIIVEQDAKLEHTVYQQCQNPGFQIANVNLAQQQASQVVLHSHGCGDGQQRFELQHQLLGEHAQCRVNALALTDKNQRRDLHIDMHHRAAECNSHIEARAVATGQSRAALTGRIIVHPDTPRTDANLQSKALLLSEQAEIDNRPQLEIYHDDVKCAHGSAIGALDEDAIFYCRARGIDEASARAMLIRGFYQVLIDELTNPDIKSQVEADFKDFCSE